MMGFVATQYIYKSDIILYEGSNSVHLYYKYVKLKKSKLVVILYVCQHPVFLRARRILCLSCTSESSLHFSSCKT